MKWNLFYSLVATSVVTASSMATSAMVLTWVPEGKPRVMAERYLIAPGELLYDKLQKDKTVRAVERAAADAADKAKDRVGETKDKLSKTAVGGAVEAVSRQAERLRHVCNVGAWALSGFALCFLMTLAFGVSSFKSAMALGLKVTVTLIFLQGALIFAGILAIQKMGG